MEETKSMTKSPTKKLGKILLIILIVMLVFVALCGFVATKLLGGAYKSYLNSKGVNYDQKNGGVTIKTDDGNIQYDNDDKSGSIKTEEGEFTYGENLTLPSDFPATVPVMSGANITAKSSKTNDGTIVIVYSVNKSKSDVHNFYKTEMQKNSWSETAAYTDRMLLFTQGQTNVTLVLSDAAKTENTSVMITVSEKK
ncbi:hypothetical protein IT418_01470 [bacterium]|nr:hypothetical protein [bacterium]